MTIYLSWRGLLPPAHFNATKSIIMSCFSPTSTAAVAVAATNNRRRRSRKKINANFNFSKSMSLYVWIATFLIFFFFFFLLLLYRCYVCVFSCCCLLSFKVLRLWKISNTKKNGWSEMNFEFCFCRARTHIIQLRLWKMIFNASIPNTQEHLFCFFFMHLLHRIWRSLYFPSHFHFGGRIISTLFLSVSGFSFSFQQLEIGVCNVCAYMWTIEKVRRFRLEYDHFDKIYMKQI